MDAATKRLTPGRQAGDLVMEPCIYPTGSGELAAECGTLVVPENRADIGSRLIALPVTRIRARSNDPAEPIFCGPPAPSTRPPSSRRWTCPPSRLPRPRSACPDQVPTTDGKRKHPP
jgi:hypothetical protein